MAKLISSVTVVPIQVGSLEGTAPEAVDEEIGRALVEATDRY